MYSRNLEANTLSELKFARRDFGAYLNVFQQSKPELECAEAHPEPSKTSKIEHPVQLFSLETPS